MGLDQLRVNRLWEAVLLTSHELVWELDPSGLIRFMTDSAEEVLGESAVQLTGRNVLSMIHPCDVDAARQVLADCVENRIGWERVRLRVGAGTVRIYGWRAAEWLTSDTTTCCSASPPRLGGWTLTTFVPRNCQIPGRGSSG